MSSPPELPPPPPSQALLHELDNLAPARTRRPGRAAALALAASIVTALTVLYFTHMRPRPAAMSWHVWWAACALLWAAAFAAPLLTLLLPRRGAMLPNVHRAGVASLVLSAAALASLVLIALDLPAPSLLPAPGHLLWQCRGCLGIGALVALLPLVLVPLLLRGVLLSRGWRAGVAVGAASGALGGLVLHLHCPVGGLHPLIAHGGCVVGAALVGAGLFRAIFR